MQITFRYKLTFNEFGVGAKFIGKSSSCPGKGKPVIKVLLVPVKVNRFYRFTFNGTRRTFSNITVQEKLFPIDCAPTPKLIMPRLIYPEKI